MLKHGRRSKIAVRPFVKILKNIIISQDVIRKQSYRSEKSTMIINCYDDSKIMLIRDIGKLDKEASHSML